MTAVPEAAPRLRVWPGRAGVPFALAAAAFVALFAQPALLLARDWWNDSEAGHGLLLAPLAVWLAWRDRPSQPQTANPRLGTSLLVAAILLRYVAGLAAELFTLRFSIVLALAGLTVFWLGERQLRRWWLPFALLTLSIPLPALVTNALTLPLQFKASALGAALLEWRHVPVRLSGNVIQLPGRQLFVTEACSGIRSLVALLSLGVLVGGLWLRTPIGRLGVLALAVPVAVVVNAVRVFLTGFLVYFLNPAMGEGFMHLTEGWLLFLVAFSVLGAGAWGIAWLEHLAARSRHAV
ncbi:MAG TPA: exosortase/archaeosortase family protein [Gemmatimonadales bacterium]